MFGPLIDCLTKIFGEERRDCSTANEDDCSDTNPTNFNPGFLFDVSATWILVITN